MGTQAHHPAAFPPKSKHHLIRNVEFFNRIAEKRKLGLTLKYFRSWPGAGNRHLVTAFDGA